MDIIQGASKLTPWFDNACDPGVYTVYGQMAQAIATGDETPESAMEQVREAAASLHYSAIRRLAESMQNEVCQGQP